MASDTRESFDSDDDLTDDVTLHEEATLGQCLMRILNSSKDPSPLPSQSQSHAASIHPSHHAYAHSLHVSTNCLSHHVSTYECPTCKLISCSDDGTDYLQLSEEDKLVKWRAAGAALHRALVDAELPTSGSTSQLTYRKISSSIHPRMSVGFAVNGDDDPMNVMLEEFRSQPRNSDSLDMLRSSPDTTECHKPRKSYREIIKEHKLKKRKSPVAETSQDNISPGLLSVREKIREIRSRIRENDSVVSKIEPKVVVVRANNVKDRGRLSRTASRELNTSSDSGDEGDVARSRCVHKCRRAVSNGRSRYFNEANIPVADHGEDASSHSIDAYEYNKVVPSEEEVVPHLAGDLSDSDDLFDIPLPAHANHMREDGSSGDDDSDTLARKLQVIAGKRIQHISHMCSKAGERPHVLSSVETDSLPNLADIESSNVSDEPDTLGETGSDNDASNSCTNATAALSAEDQSRISSCRIYSQLTEPSAFTDPSAYCTRLHKSTRSRKQPQPIHTEDDSGYPCGDFNDDDYDDDELEDLGDLDLRGTVSDSDAENCGKVELCPEDLDSLPHLISEESSYCESEDVDADDEFECDCSLCQQRRGNDLATSHDVQESLLISGSRHIDHQTEDGNQEESDPTLYSINMAELTPLDVLLMREGRREVLELFQNVIMQMLSVYPDLLGDQAPPPAPAILINSLPMMIIQQRHLDADFICPICLCNFEVEEEVRCLPCQHLFHTLCIQAWLGKSGTCPVCRHILLVED